MEEIKKRLVSDETNRLYVRTREYPDGELITNKEVDVFIQSEIDLAVSKERERIVEILENNRNETLWGDEESNEVAKKTIDEFIIAVKDELNTK